MLAGLFLCDAAVDGTFYSLQLGNIDERSAIKIHVSLSVESLGFKKKTRAARATDLKHGGSDEGPPRADVDRMHELKVVDNKSLAIIGYRIESAGEEKLNRKTGTKEEKDEGVFKGRCSLVA